MARKKTGNGSNSPGKTPAASVDEQPQSLELASRGVRSGQDFADLMSKLMADVISGKVAPSTANAACNAGAKLLRVVEMQYRYGNTRPTQRPDFMLTSGE